MHSLAVCGSPLPYPLVIPHPLQSPPPWGGANGPKSIENTRRQRRQRKFLQGAESHFHCDTMVQFCGAFPPWNRHFVTAPPPPPSRRWWGDYKGGGGGGVLGACLRVRSKFSCAPHPRQPCPPQRRPCGPHKPRWPSAFCWLCAWPPRFPATGPGRGTSRVPCRRSWSGTFSRTFSCRLLLGRRVAFSPRLMLRPSSRPLPGGRGSLGAHRVLCAHCAKSRLFSTTGSHGSQGPEFCTPDAVLNSSCTPL